MHKDAFVMHIIGYIKVIIIELLRSFLTIYKPIENIFLCPSLSSDLNNINQ